MKISKLIEKLSKIQDTYGDIEIGHKITEGYNSSCKKADGVEVKVRCPKTAPKVTIKTWCSTTGWYL